MNFVVDANVFMSALINTQGKTYDLIFNDKLRLLAPEYLMDEVEKYKEEIILKSGLTQSEFDLFLLLISSRIEFVSCSGFSDLISEAKSITPDENDTEYFALALKFKCSLWSNDKKLREQEIVKVYSTNELLEMFKDEN